MPSAELKSNVVGWLMKSFTIFGPRFKGPFILSECSFTVWEKAKAIISYKYKAQVYVSFLSQTQ